MSTPSKDTISLPRWLMTALISLLSAGVVGGIGVAWTANSWAAKIEERLDNTTKTAVMANAQGMNLLPRITAVEQEMKSIKENTLDNRQQLREIDRKIDRLLQRRGQ